MKPVVRPGNPLFSSGPCPKRPGWSLEVLAGAYLGRSHRAAGPLARIRELLERSRALLGLPDEWRLGIVPGSDTGAIEMAMWSLLGPRGVDFLSWDNFGALWANDGARELRPLDARVIEAPYGRLPDLTRVDPARDTVFVWNGTTSGVRVPDAAWIAADRAGLTFCDATSAVFAYPMDWTKLDATSYSWQKVMGGEAGFGMLILGPRAVARLEAHEPPWPVPRVFRLTAGDGRLNEGIFRGETINTVSMMAVEDALDALRWIESIGGPGRDDGTGARQFRRRRVVGRGAGLGRLPGAGAGDALPHIGLPQHRRPLVHRARRGRSVGRHPADVHPARSGGRGL